MNMINKAGNQVQPTVSAVQSAMNDFSFCFQSGNFSIDIIDPPGHSSWPMAYMNFLSLYTNATAFDCTNIQELMTWTAWVYTNDAYVMPILPSWLHRCCSHSLTLHQSLFRRQKE